MWDVVVVVMKLMKENVLKSKDVNTLYSKS